MKLAICRNAAVLSIMASAFSYADTVTTSDHLSVNGVLSKMAEGTITLQARVSSGPKTLVIPTSGVEAIEFTSIAFNPGAPRKAYGLGPGVSRESHPHPTQQPALTDAIELRRGNGEQQPCRVVMIDEYKVFCKSTVSGGKKEGEQREYSRRIVLRVLFGGDQ